MGQQPILCACLPHQLPIVYAVSIQRTSNTNSAHFTDNLHVQGICEVEEGTATIDPFTVESVVGQSQSSQPSQASATPASMTPASQAHATPTPRRSAAPRSAAPRSKVARRTITPRLKLLQDRVTSFLKRNQRDGEQHRFFNSHLDSQQTCGPPSRRNCRR